LANKRVSNTFRIDYRFTLPDRRREDISLRFDRATMVLRNHPRQSPPFWTELTFNQCSHCPLSKTEYPHCPVALNLVTVYHRMGKLMSFDKVTVNIITEQRRICNRCSAQEAISSIMGLVIAASRCPHTHFLKPMARFHLPFANREETIWRALATYLLARHFEGLKKADLSLDGLVKIYDNIARINDAMVVRLRAASRKDSMVNALVHLDVFAKFMMPPLDDTLASIRALFKPFLENGFRK